jgi:hypothetical protein
VFDFREEAENFTACHQFTSGREDDTEAEVAFVALYLYTVKFRSRSKKYGHTIVYRGVRCSG